MFPIKVRFIKAFALASAATSLIKIQRLYRLVWCHLEVCVLYNITAQPVSLPFVVNEYDNGLSCVQCIILYTTFITVCPPVPPLQPDFPFPRFIQCNFPSIPQRSSDFPSFHLTAAPTCLPVSTSSISYTPYTYQSCSFVSSFVAVLPRALLFHSCPASWYFCGNLNLLACMPVTCISSASFVCIWIQSCFSLNRDNITHPNATKHIL